MSTSHKSRFGSETRALDGCIVTYQLPDDTIIAKRFTTIIHYSNAGQQPGSRRYGKIAKRIGPTYIEQAIAWCDEHNAKIVSISTPETILRDLSGSRSHIDQGSKRRVHDQVSNPESSMLKRRVDLLATPTPSRNLTGQHMKQVRSRRASHAGRLNQ